MFFHWKQSFVFSFCLTFSVSVKLGEAVTYPGPEVMSLHEKGPLWSVYPASCWQSWIWKEHKLRLSPGWGGSPWLGGRWGWSLIDWSQSPVWAGHHLGSGAVTTLQRTGMTETWGLGPALLTWLHFPWWSCCFCREQSQRRGWSLLGSGGCD